MAEGQSVAQALDIKRSAVSDTVLRVHVCVDVYLCGYYNTACNTYM